MSIQCNNIEETIKNTKKLYENKELQKEMIKAQEKEIKRDTCDKIIEKILSYLEGEIWKKQ